MKRGIAVLCGLVLAAAAAFAGGNAQSGSKDAGTGTEQVTIRLLSRWSGTDSNAPIWQAAQKEFMAANPNVKIVDESVNEENAYNNKFKTDLATGNLPAVFGVNGILLGAEYAKNGLLLDVSPYMAADTAWSSGLIEGCVNAIRFDQYGVKGVYGVPTANAIEVMYYNKDLFAQVGVSKVPETYEELLDIIRKLRAAGITPIGAGAKATWRIGHIHNALLYKTVGVEKAVDLGINRKAKWTDPDVVQSLRLLKELKDMGAFDRNFEGIDYETEKTLFLSGKSAMVFNGTWFMGEVEQSAISDKIGVFLFPYMKDKPQFKDHNIIFPQNLSISAKLSPAQREAAVGFMKYYSSKLIQERMAYETKNLPARNDLKLDPAKTGKLFEAVNALAGTIKVGGSDSFSYDPVAAMQDRTRNSFIGMLLGNTPEQAAKEIQDEIDRNR